MNGVLAVQSRILELRSQLQSLQPVAPTRLATTSAVPQDFSTLLSSALAGGSPASEVTSRPGTSSPTGADLVTAASRYLGVPYRWGGTDPATGLDCSALVQRAMKDLGVDVPRVVADQRHVGTEVPNLDQARPGDLVVLGGSRHIGIYVGDGKMLHAPRSGEVVKITDVYETPTSIRRVLPESSGGAGYPALDATALRPAALRGGSTAGINDQVRRFEPLFAAATAQYGLPAGLLAAVAQTESSGNASAVSPAGATGLMQIMPATARGLGVDPLDPRQAVDGAARLLAGHLRDFGSLDLALAAYNAGPGAVRRHGGVPPYTETQQYVRRVTSLLGQDT